MSATNGASQRHARPAAGDSAGRRRSARPRRVRRSRAVAALVCTATVAVLSAVMLAGAAAGTPGVTTRESVVSETLNADADEASRRAAISGDGRYVAFQSDALNLVPGVIIPEQTQVYRRDRQTGVVEVVSVDADGQPFSGGAARPSISADGNRIAFEGESNLLPAGPEGSIDVGDLVFISNAEGGQDVFLARSDGTDPENLTNDPGAVHADPVLSPDGTRVAFSRVDTPEGGSNVYVMNLDGTERRAVTKAGGTLSFQQPAWSPDGSRLVLAGSGLNEAEMATEALFIAEVDAVGTEPERITNLNVEGIDPDEGGDRDPDWSPNGDRIIFSARRPETDGEFSLVVLHLAVGVEQPIGPAFGSPITLVEPRQPKWSPTAGNTVVFTAAPSAGADEELFVGNLALGGEFPCICPIEQLSFDGGFDPSWRRDGAGVVFASEASPDTTADLFELPITAADNPDVEPLRLTTNPLGAAGATTQPHVGPTFMTRETDLRVTATLAGVEGRPPPTGEVTFRICSPSETFPTEEFGRNCGEFGGRRFGAPVAVTPAGDGGVAVSISTADAVPPIRFDEVGMWCASFTYRGDERYRPVHHTGPESLCVEVTSAVADASLSMDLTEDFDDGEVTTTLALSGPTTPGGLATFFLCDPAEIDAAGCSEGGTQVGPPLVVQPNGGTTSTARPDINDSPELTESGRYCWRAEYSGTTSYQRQVVVDNGQACFTVEVGGELPELVVHPVVDVSVFPGGELWPPHATSVQITAEFFAADETTVPEPHVVSVFLCAPSDVDRFGCRSGGEPVAEGLVLDSGAATVNGIPIGETGPHCFRVELTTPEDLVAVDHSSMSCVVARAPSILTSDTTQVWVRDLAAGTTTLVSALPDGTPASDISTMAAISPEGGHVAFSSRDNELADFGDVGWYDGTHVFLRDLDAATTELVSVQQVCPFGECWAGDSIQASVSENGASVAFASNSEFIDAINPVTGTPHQPPFSEFAFAVYVRDMAVGVTEIASVTNSGFAPEFSAGETVEGSAQPSIDASGRRIAFTSDFAEMIDGDTNDVANVFVRDRDAMTTLRVSVSSLGVPGDLPSFEPAISADGRTVAFASAASTLVPDITNNATCVGGGEFPVEFPCLNADVFVHDLVRGTTARVSVDSDDTETELGADSRRPAISTDGRFVAFDSDSTQLVDGDGNGFRDVFIRDRTPVLVVLPDPAVFADQLVGTDSAPITVSAINAGSGPLQVSELTITGDAADFSIVPGTDACTGASLFAGDVCTVDIRFNPTVAGARSAFLNVASTAPGSPVSAVLQGTGTQALAEVTPDPLDFGTVPALGVPETRIATLSSIGTAPVTVTDVTIGGPDAARFFVAAGDDGCTGLAVAPAAGCGVVVSFAPQEARDHTATLTFTDNALGSPRTITMIGAGQITPTLQAFQLTPDPLDFGLVQRGTTTPPGVVTGLSTGDVAVPLGGVDIAGAHPGDFVIVTEDETCAGANVAPGASCQIPIRFAPTEVGPREATLRVMVAGELRTTRLIGAGFDPDPVLTLEPDPADFGVVVAEDVSEPQILTATNVSEATIPIAEVAIVLPPPADGEDPPELPEFAITEDGDGCTGVILAPGGTCELAVVFAPVVPGQKSAVALVRGSTGALADAELIGLSPEVEPLPALGPPGFVTEIVGRDFPPDERLVIEWDPGLGFIEVTTNAEGTFRTPMLVMRRDRIGLREVVAIGPDGSYRVVAEFLVTPGTAQPADFISRR